jgi:hypothetical protein
MIRRHREGNPNCYFCDDNETSSHLFFPTQLQMWFGLALLISVWEQTISLEIFRNVGNGGVKRGYPKVENVLCGV